MSSALSARGTEPDKCCRSSLTARTDQSISGTSSGRSRTFRLCRESITLLDGFPDAGAALLGGQTSLARELLGDVGQPFVLDLFPEPAGEVALLEVEQPRGIVHAVGDLEEHQQ